jgi:hypothetical protein
MDVGRRFAEVGRLAARMAKRQAIASDTDGRQKKAA